VTELTETWPAASEPATPDNVRIRVGLGAVKGVSLDPVQVRSLSALFPHLLFLDLGADWSRQQVAGFAATIISADSGDVADLLKHLDDYRGGPPMIVILSGANAITSRRLTYAGAAEVLAAPVSEAALALSLERLLSGSASTPRGASGRLIGLIKAGGGVGATALGTQLTVILAGRSQGVCFADLDVQFGIGALALDIEDGMTLADVMRGAGALEDAPLKSALATHSSGAKLLAAPRELVPLEGIETEDVDGLMKALRREFAITLLDMPTAWTAWTHHALQLCDQILMVTNLSLAHIHLVNRQLAVLKSQGLGSIPLTIIFNRVNDDQQLIVSLKDARQAIGRDIDFIIPEDGKLMNAAMAQGLALSAVRPGAKLEKAIDKLADVIAPLPVAEKKTGRFRWL
jgi:pilus assembly protein CpaE